MRYKGHIIIVQLSHVVLIFSRRNLLGALSGTYKIIDNCVIGILRKPKVELQTPSFSGFRSRRRRQQEIIYDEAPEQEFQFVRINHVINFFLN